MAAFARREVQAVAFGFARKNAPCAGGVTVSDVGSGILPDLVQNDIRVARALAMLSFSVCFPL